MPLFHMRPLKEYNSKRNYENPILKLIVLLYITIENNCEPHARDRKEAEKNMKKSYYSSRLRLEPGSPTLLFV